MTITYRDPKPTARPREHTPGDFGGSSGGDHRGTPAGGQIDSGRKGSRAEFEVSPIPVREALRQLETEGWVVFLPNKGATVAPLSIDEALEIYDILASLECTALRLAIPHHTLATLERAEEALYTAPTAGVDNVNLNSDFHLALYAPSQQPRLLNLIDGQRQRVQRYLRLYLASAEVQTADGTGSGADICRHV